MKDLLTKYYSIIISNVYEDQAMLKKKMTGQLNEVKKTGKHKFMHAAMTTT